MQLYKQCPWKRRNGKDDPALRANDANQLWPTLPTTITSFPGPFFYRKMPLHCETLGENKRNFKCIPCGGSNYDHKHCPASIDGRRALLAAELKCLNCLMYLVEDGKKLEEHDCGQFNPCYHCKKYGHNSIVCGDRRHLIFLMRPDIYFQLEQSFEIEAYSRTRNGMDFNVVRKLRAEYDPAYHGKFIKAAGVFNEDQEMAYQGEVAYSNFELRLASYGFLNIDLFRDQTKKLQTDHIVFLEDLARSRIQPWPFKVPKVPIRVWQ